MLDDLKPDMVCRAVFDIDLDALTRLGIRALMFDLDNTLTLWNGYEYSPELKSWLDGCRARGFKACICSNNHAPRIKPVADELGLPFIDDAGKPGDEAYRRVCLLLGTDAAHIAAVGDQLMTDVIGAKRHGMHAVLVNPLGRREFIGTYFNRIAERVLLCIMRIHRPR